MMIYITQEHCNLLEAAAQAGSKEMRKEAFKRIKADLGIPSNVRIGVDRNAAGSVRNALYYAGSEPRRYLQREDFTSADDSEANGKFVVLGTSNSNRRWSAISRSDLLALLRMHGNESIDYDPILPDGFPVGVSGSDVLVLDSATGTLYFK
jgi:hypothetical protein